MNNCQLSGICGGCLYQGVPYSEQTAKKEKEVLDLLETNHIEYGEFAGLEPAPSVTAYRNKMEYTFGDMEKGGPTTLGMHRSRSYMSVVNTDDCMLVDDDFNLIRKSVLDFCTGRGYVHYNKKRHNGLLRNLIIRKGERTGELLVCIVTTSEEGFDEDGFKEMLLALPLKSEIVGIMRTVNDNIADRVTNEDTKVLYGRDHYNEKIMGLDFQVNIFAFFQTNISAVERLYTEALEMIDDVTDKTVFDLYCGTGTITQTLALKAKKAVGVEISADAVRSAHENAELNGLTNCEFMEGDVLKVLDNISEKPDVIVLDPPRAGIHYKVLPKLMNYGVDQILYISCNPKTMAPNLAFMQEHGYRVMRIKAYDNFPFTKHVETVVLMSRVEGK
ncbi:MAG: 23S rRNA (uracil(1939)-C(5))-methyltransferase RlmD [Anaerovoracaceae bacterium]|nr:23S rRNA (uracil(1939)-C(5))-methyltransferase RlmD [Bacillota bacterium]MDY2671428.1 23S rRNA (uracil(1939)-C(5))-methyltransferase RlmD [Anaerovoracaceae bacterium]